MLIKPKYPVSETTTFSLNNADLLFGLKNYEPQIVYGVLTRFSVEFS